MIYALHDYDETLKAQGAFKIEFKAARKLNYKGFGIHFSPNIFRNGNRKIEDLVRIRYWFADLDKGFKPFQMDIIKKLLLKPSCIVETKRGYHLYWRAKDAIINNYNNIMIGIIKKLNSDESVKGCNRLMRMPGFYHFKDKYNPILVKLIERNNNQYSDKEMLYYFPVPKQIKKTDYNPKDHSDMLNPEYWDRIFKLNNIKNGNRNNEFTRIVFWLRDSGFNAQQITDAVHEMNRRIYEPLSEGEINMILKDKI